MTPRAGLDHRIASLVPATIRSGPAREVLLRGVNDEVAIELPTAPRDMSGDRDRRDRQRRRSAIHIEMS